MCISGYHKLTRTAAAGVSFLINHFEPRLTRTVGSDDRHVLHADFALALCWAEDNLALEYLVEVLFAELVVGRPPFAHQHAGVLKVSKPCQMVLELELHRVGEDRLEGLAAWSNVRGSRRHTVSRRHPSAGAVLSALIVNERFLLLSATYSSGQFVGLLYRDG